MTTIDWNVSDTEADIIRRIAKRAVAELELDDLQTVEMDITACHLNGCKLNLEKLASAPVRDFGHDVLGIRRHINRTTGQLRGFFDPRCSKDA